MLSTEIYGNLHHLHADWNFLIVCVQTSER